MNEKTEPLACPWCGHVGVEYFEPSTYRYGAAMCGECAVVGPEVRKGSGEPREEWTPRALAAWNNRAASPSSKSTKEAQDAARYRWLRDHSGTDAITVLGVGGFASLDAFIDDKLASSSIKEDGERAVIERRRTEYTPGGQAMTVVEYVSSPPSPLGDTPDQQEKK